MINVPDKKYPWESNIDHTVRKEKKVASETYKKQVKKVVDDLVKPLDWSVPPDWTLMDKKDKKKIKDVMCNTFQVEDIQMEELPQVAEAVEKQLMERDVVYISGPMEASGLKDLNYPAFNMAAQKLRSEGFTVLNPAETDDGSVHRPRNFYLRADVKMVASANKLFMLEGWEKSPGAKLEVYVARALEIPIFSFRTREEIKDDLLSQAYQIVNNDRRDAYDHPMNNFKRIALMWEGFKGIKFTPEDVGCMMVLVKVAREAFKHTPDNLVDIVGYTLTLDMIKQKRKELSE